MKRIRPVPVIFCFVVLCSASLSYAQTNGLITSRNGMMPFSFPRIEWKIPYSMPQEDSFPMLVFRTKDKAFYRILECEKDPLTDFKILTLKRFKAVPVFRNYFRINPQIPGNGFRIMPRGQDGLFNFRFRALKEKFDGGQYRLP